jgi:biofilm PGA synthesis N-glycosyltransferase PgaC
MDLTIQVHRQRLGRITFAHRAVAFTQDPRTIRGYIGQITRWYSGTWQVMWLHRLPFGRQRVDAEVAVLLGEGLLYSALTLVLPLLLWVWPRAILTWLALDQLLVGATAFYCAMVVRRLDVLVWWPAFVVLRWINAFVLLTTFWQEIVLRRARRHWFSVGRYEAA